MIQHQMDCGATTGPVPLCLRLSCQIPGDQLPIRVALDQTHNSIDVAFLDHDAHAAALIDWYQRPELPFIRRVSSH